MQASRYLPILIALLLIEMPICLAMVFSRTYKHWVDVQLSARSYLAALSNDLVLLSELLAGTLLNIERVSPPSSGICSFDIYSVVSG
jgi:hypothetical protein